MSAEKLGEVRDIYRKNYQILDYSEESIEALIVEINQKIKLPETDVRVWEVGEQEMLAFTATTEDVNDQTVYVSGLNINPELKVARAARGLLEETVQEYIDKGWVVTAESSPRIFQGYSEMGWVATGYKKDDLGEESSLLDIAVYPQHDFVSKSMSRKELRARVSDTDEAIGEDGLVVVRSDNESTASLLLQKGYVITRFFRDKGRDGQSDSYISVLEPAPSQIVSREIQTQNVA